MTQAFDNDSVNEHTVRRWFAKFCSGDFSFEDVPRSGRPTVIQDEDLSTLMRTYPSQMVRGTTEERDVSIHAVRGTLKCTGEVGKVRKVGVVFEINFREDFLCLLSLDKVKISIPGNLESP